MERRTRHVLAAAVALLVIGALGWTLAGPTDRTDSRPAPAPRSVMGATVNRPATTGVTTSTTSPATQSDTLPPVSTPIDRRRRQRVYWWEITKTVTAPPSSGEASVVSAPQASSSAGGASPTTALAARQPLTITWPGWEVQMLREVNSQRAAVGASPLTLCYSLNLMAEAQSDSQAKLNEMTHTGADGAGMGPRADAAGYFDWTLLAENIGEGYPDAESVMVAWVDSPDHLENMRYPQLTNVGFAESTSSTGITYWTQDFGTDGSC